MNHRIFLLLACGITGPLFGENNQENDPMTRGLADIRYKVTQIEAESTNKVPALVALAKQADHWVERYPEKPEPVAWKREAIRALIRQNEDLK